MAGNGLQQTRQAQLQRARRIREQVNLALSEQPNELIRDRLEKILMIANDLLADAQPTEASGSHSGTAKENRNREPR